jgi:hypothetical protein
MYFVGLERAGLSDGFVPFLLPVARKYSMFRVGSMSYMECMYSSNVCVCVLLPGCS